MDSQHYGKLFSFIWNIANDVLVFAFEKGDYNLRRHIIENDMLEAIVAMPEKDFYNTGIGTYVWIVTNRKEPRRRGKVQLIDATAALEKETDGLLGEILA